MAMQPGWFDRQSKRVAEEIAAWPEWMKRAAGLTDTTNITGVNPMSDSPLDIQARQVGNAVFLEHKGMSGDIAAWGMKNSEQAKVIASLINLRLEGLWSEIKAVMVEAKRLPEQAHPLPRG